MRHTVTQPGTHRRQQILLPKSFTGPSRHSHVISGSLPTQKGTSAESSCNKWDRGLSGGTPVTTTIMICTTWCAYRYISRVRSSQVLIFYVPGNVLQRVLIAKVSLVWAGFRLGFLIVSCTANSNLEYKTRNAACHHCAGASQ